MKDYCVYLDISIVFIGAKTLEMRLPSGARGFESLRLRTQKQGTERYSVFVYIKGFYNICKGKTWCNLGGFPVPKGAFWCYEITK